MTLELPSEPLNAKDAKDAKENHEAPFLLVARIACFARAG
jgi:hypothetical protein